MKIAPLQFEYGDQVLVVRREIVIRTAELTDGDYIVETESGSYLESDKDLVAIFHVPEAEL